jgi:hypothetical protein
MSDDLEGIYFSDMDDEEQHEAIRLTAIDLNLYRKALHKETPTRTSSLLHIALVIAAMYSYAFLAYGSVRPSGGMGTIVFVIVVLSVVIAEFLRHRSFQFEVNEFRIHSDTITSAIEEVELTRMFAKYNEYYQNVDLDQLVQEARRNLDNRERLYAR